MSNLNYLDEKIFEANVKDNINELSSLVEEYEQEDKESEIAEFSKYDPFKNIILGLAEKLRTQQNLEADESLQKADDIVREAEHEVKKPDARKRICAALKSFSGDALTLTPVIIELSKAGIFAISFDPTGVLVGSVVCLLIVKMGVEAFCAD